MPRTSRKKPEKKALATKMYLPPEVLGWPISIPESALRRAPASLGSSLSLKLYWNGPDMVLFGGSGAKIGGIDVVREWIESMGELVKGREKERKPGNVVVIRNEVWILSYGEFTR